MPEKCIRKKTREDSPTFYPTVCPGSYIQQRLKTCPQAIIFIIFWLIFRAKDSLLKTCFSKALSEKNKTKKPKFFF
jgi:hypothetical protein